VANCFVDSCVLLDIFNDDVRFADWAMHTLADQQADHDLVINSIVFSEVSLNFESCEDLEAVLTRMRIRVLPIPNQAAFSVSRAFKKYKKNKGEKNSALPDFYIGAHAEALGAAIVTRDLARYKTYFPSVPLITHTV